MNHENSTTYSYSENYPEVFDTSGAQKLEIDHFVKEAPRFSSQLQEDDRTNSIIHINGSVEGLLTNAHDDDYSDSRETVSEIDALRELNTFLDLVQDELPDYANEARLMQENLTYIGEKEYKEASAAIAAYWKECLDSDPNLQILALVGEIAKKQQKRQNSSALAADLPIKSDEYLLENILENFSDEELAGYAGRLLVDAANFTSHPSDTRVVLLDDWTISGSQLFDAYSSFVEDNPDYASAVEVQLIASGEKNIIDGFLVDAGEGGDTIPLRAYYKAHHSDYGWRGSNHVHITGSHSAVDFDFEDEIQVMVEELNAKGVAATMPATTNIVRPYRLDGMTRANLVERGRLDMIRHMEVSV